MPAEEVHRAAREGQSHLVAQALEADNGASINERDSDGRTVLSNAATSGSVETVQAVLKYKPDLEVRDSLGWTPIIIAASAGSVDVVKELIGAGSNVAASNDRDQTALHYAASKGYTDIGKLLIEKGADINARDKANQLPLHRAATTGATPFIKLILASESTGSFKKPRLNLQDRAGNTPLHLAIESGHAEAAVALRCIGGTNTVRDHASQFRIPLWMHNVVKNSEINFARFVCRIEAGADRQRTNSDGERPEDIAGVGGQEGRRLLDYIKERCGKLE